MKVIKPTRKEILRVWLPLFTFILSAGWFFWLIHDKLGEVILLVRVLLLLISALSFLISFAELAAPTDGHFFSSNPRWRLAARLVLLACSYILIWYPVAAVNKAFSFLLIISLISWSLQELFGNHD